MKTIDNSIDLMNLLEGIEMVGTRLADWNFRWSLNTVSELNHDRDEARQSVELGGDRLERGTEIEGWLVQCSFERPDVNGEFTEQGLGYGREWFIRMGTPDTGVVFTAWMAIQQIVIHELHESFTVMVDGKRVRLLDPHKSLADLAVGSRSV